MKYQALSTQIITFHELSVVISRKRVKYIRIRIDRTGHIKVSVPIFCSMKTVMTFLQEKELWIKTHVTRLQEQAKSLSIPSTQMSDHYSHLGKQYLVKQYETSKKSYVQLEEDHIACYLTTKSIKQDVQQLVTHWQRKQMQALLPYLIAKWEPIIGVQVLGFGVRVMTSRWGSCHPLKKRICLNLHLIKKPMICLEYVLVHEMVHILEASHNQRFYALMTQFMPEWKTYKRMLHIHH